jgi:hypothetical protein
MEKNKSLDKVKVLDEEKIKMLKHQYGKLILVELEQEGEQPAEQFVFKKPNMATVSAASRFTQNDPMRATLILFNDCLVWGDKTIVDDPEKFLSVSQHMQDLLKVRVSNVKEL